MSARLPFMLAFAIGMAPPAVAQQQGALTLADRRLAPGTTVGLTGARFRAGALLALALEGPNAPVPSGSVIAGPDGAFADSLRVPGRLTTGAYRLVARDRGAIVAGLDVAVLGDSAVPMAAMSHGAGARAGQDSGAPMAGMSHGTEPGAAKDSSAPMAGMSHTAAAPGAEAEHAHVHDSAAAGHPGTTILGYDWPRLHAALNDLPAALLMVALLFEIAGLLARRPSLRAASFWTLLAGLAGMIPAIVAGLMAEDIIDHDDVGHAIMQRHKILALVTLGLFVGLALWRVVRRKSEHRKEGVAWCLAAAVGVAFLVTTAQLGGKLMFDHAMGIPSAEMVEILEQRGAMPAPETSDSAQADSTSESRTPGAAPHHDAPGTPPHSHAKRPAQP